MTDQAQFQRILTRNIAAPLVAGVLSAVLFVATVAYLLNVLGEVEHTDRVIGRAYEVSKLLIDEETGMRGFLLTGDDQFLDPYDIAVARIAGELDNLRVMVADNPPQLDRLRSVSATQNEWLSFAREMVALRRSEGDYQAVVRSARGKRLTDAMRAQFEGFIGLEQRLRAERTERANSGSIMSVVVYLAISLMLTGLLAFFGRREMLSLSGSYGAALGKQKAHADLLEAQAWLREGQALLSRAVEGGQDLASLGRNAVEFLNSYLGSPVGALYVSGAGAPLRQVASYGFAAEHAQHEQTHAPAQSLVSEAATQKRTIRLDNVPQDYIRVSSGLGHSTAQSVLIVPLSHEGTVNGVVEVGFLRPLTPRDVEFLETSAPMLAAAMEAARYRERLQHMLEETQQLNEELQVQQEELRTANEELEERSVALKESQAHLESQQAELEQTNEQLSGQRDELDRNNRELSTAQQELERRSMDLQRASQYKSEFLANMSHELRTPLNSSLILARMLADNGGKNLTPEQVKFAESIYASGNDLLDLINDILDIAKVEAGKLDVRPEVTALSGTAEALRNTFEPLAKTKGLGFSLQLAPGLPATIFTDRQRLEQILKNLLSNAVKFTDAGSVSLLISRRGAGELAFAVKDSGIGIDASQQQVVFEAFRQADGTTSRKYGGTGLGLSISRDLAGLLGGSIDVQSAPGQGSTFTLVLPLEYTAGAAALPAALAPPPIPTPPIPTPAAPTPPRAPRAAPIADDRDKPLRAQQRRVLVVEDEPQFARILLELARELGYSGLVAQDSEEAWELAERFIPDAMLLDMRLPDGSGLAVLQKVKDSPQTRHVPVHVISVDDLSEAALQMGAIGYARKPTTREQLQGVFARIEAKLSQKVKRVLVVEDDTLQRESIVRLIGDDDIDITPVGTGEEALGLLRATIFDCMVIDLKLPDMSGNELLRRVATENIASFPPVIVYTGRNLTRDEEAELMRYSRSIIIKGARSPERLLDEVTLFLHKVETDLSSERRKMLETARNRDKLLEGRRILLVDDDVRNIFALTSALEYKGATVETGRNGIEALDKLRRIPDIDLVLMDIMMPEMDGYTAIREIRKEPRWKSLPIIAVTAKAMRDDQERCLAAGANDYLAKPVELERLFSLLRVWMPKMERI